VRWIIGFCFGAALLGAGLYVLYVEAFVARVIMGKMIIMGTVLTGAGAAWLWVDYLSPIIRGRPERIP
jgi:hypothetical protein